MSNFSIGDEVKVVGINEGATFLQSGIVTEIEEDWCLVDFGQPFYPLTHRNGGIKIYPLPHYRWYINSVLEIIHRNDEVLEISNDELDHIIGGTQ